jgi:EpsI family protein
MSHSTQAASPPQRATGVTTLSANLRFALVAILLVGVTLFLRFWSHNELIPTRENFSSLPHQLGEWAGVDSNIQQDVLALLGPGDFLLRSYQTSSAENPPVDLFLAYFPSQRTGDTIHSPKHCLPGSGWLPVESNQITLSLQTKTPFLVNRYVIAKGSQRALAVYWYWAHNRAVASEYWAKFYLIGDSIRLNRSDGSLIRVTTELKSGETAGDAEPRLVSLLNTLAPVLDQYIPR